jgi:prepilin-type N-terminal cleavage/methylation domain-containing protein
MCRSSELKARKGFTLVELAVVIVIIGVLAAFGVPRFIKSVERSKAAESFNYLSAVRDAQERYIAREGIYASNISLLDITQSSPKYFILPTGNAITVTAGTAGDSVWSMQLTRDTTTSSYGGYTVQFTQDGFDNNASNSNISADISPMGTPTGG